MIDLYTWPTPNGHKIHIMLEETGLDYTVHAVDIGSGEQFEADFLKISPNNRIPAIIDRDGPGGAPFALFESGAILMYLAEKVGRFMPADTAGRTTVVQWLMFQIGGIGPMLGQAHHFREYAKDRIPYAYDRYTKESSRLCGVCDTRLGESAYLAGDDYSIADMAVFPWLINPQREGWVPGDFPHLKRWNDAIMARPAVTRGLQVLSEHRRPPMTDERREILFGATQFKRR